MEDKTQPSAATSTQIIEMAQKLVRKPFNPDKPGLVEAKMYVMLNDAVSALNEAFSLGENSVALLKPAPDTAKEQAGRKMFEALGNTIQTLRLMLAGNPDYPKEARIEVRAEIKLADAALNAGREAGWGK